MSIPRSRPSLSVEGKVALITGGKGGLGSAMALTLAEAGADVALADLVVEDGALEAVANQVRKFGRRSLAIQADIRRKPDVDNMVEAVIDKFGCIDILINTPTHVTPDVPLVELPEDEWDKTISTKLKGYYLCSQAVAKRMIGRQTGNIISFSGTLGFKAIVGFGAYQIAQAGVIMFTKVLAQELASYNIRVNAVAPSVVYGVPLSRREWSDPERLKAMEPLSRLGRLAETSDIACAVLFLASDASNYITGLTLLVDGGAML